MSLLQGKHSGGFNTNNMLILRAFRQLNFLPVTLITITANILDGEF
jgi:hypothetical protein